VRQLRSRPSRPQEQGRDLEPAVSASSSRALGAAAAPPPPRERGQQRGVARGVQEGPVATASKRAGRRARPRLGSARTSCNDVRRRPRSAPACDRLDGLPRRHALPGTPRADAPRPPRSRAAPSIEKLYGAARVEGEARGGCQVPGGDARAVAGDADEAHVPALARSTSASRPHPARAPPASRAPSTRLWSWIRSITSLASRCREPLEASRARPRRALVGLGGEEERVAARGIQAPTRSSESPYIAAVSMWFTPCSSSRRGTASALSCRHAAERPPRRRSRAAVVTGASERDPFHAAPPVGRCGTVRSRRKRWPPTSPRTGSCPSRPESALFLVLCARDGRATRGRWRGRSRACRS